MIADFETDRQTYALIAILRTSTAPAYLGDDCRLMSGLVVAHCGPIQMACEGVLPFRRMPCKLFFPSFSFLIPFINAIQLFYGCQRNVRKNITATVSVRVSVTVRVSLV